jgi:hypothetical protein
MQTEAARRPTAPKPLAKVLCLSAIWVLASIFLFAAFTKLFDFPQFLANLAPYGIERHTFQVLAGWGILVAEVLLGISLLTGWRPKLALLGILTMLLLFMTETLIHRSALTGTQCGCFGPLSASSPGSSLVHQGVTALLATAVGIVVYRRPGVAQNRVSTRAWMGASAVTVALLTAFFLQPGGSSAQVADGAGIQVRAVLSATCSHCQQMAAGIALLQSGTPSPRLKVYIGADSREQIDDFLAGTQVHLDYVPVTFRQLRNMSTRVPAVQVTRNGEVIRNWVGELPSPAEIQSVVAQERNGHGN